MNLFYADPKEIFESRIVIRGQEADHITRVLRMSKGDPIHVTDGRGTLYRGSIQNAAKKQVSISIREYEEVTPSSVFTTLCLGYIRKRDRMEFAVEKCVELGIRQIVIFRGEHSQKGGIRLDRLRSTALSAMKQSLRCFLPDVFVEESLEEALSNHARGSEIFLADEKAAAAGSLVISGNENRFIVIGPEGGFSAGERQLLQNYNTVSVSLGKHRLRAETAAVVMAAKFTAD
ncbi:MAG: RsmE family RNA methyltransferase [Bacteroidetes bacterium]|jgi:16S rRNA (uracil1498-N3)-methyltransferase|nr:RsmE family RNA methyltransferase [Bacteroidota bacterium]